MKNDSADVDGDLWDAVQAAFHYAPTRAKAIAQVDRILRKDHPALPLNYISEDTCAIRREWYGLAELRRLRRRHSNDKPRRDAGPIVVVEYGPERYVVDGTRRTNLRISLQTSQHYEAVVIARKHQPTFRLIMC
jgi:hypothetical protein